MESYLTAEISASAVAANCRLIRQRLLGGSKLCAVVKADCYGHGIRQLLGVIARWAGCLAVATPDEAIRLRQLGYDRPILMFFSACAYSDGVQLRQALGELIAQNVTLTVVSAAEAQVVCEVARKVGAEAKVHIKMDTGMGRSGVPAEAAGALAHEIGRHGDIRLTGLYTHFATANEADASFLEHQLRRFKAAAAGCGRAGLTLHCANSAATVSAPQSHLDMVRPGIALYGYQPCESPGHQLALRPCMRLWGRLMQIKDAPAGSSCGYGLCHTFQRASRLGLVPMGYGDGYFRSLSDKATMRICGHDVPIRGRVSMDQIIVDLTDVPQAQVGDIIEIISPHPAAPNSVENLARLAGTIPYELTCRLGRRVRRVLVDCFEHERELEGAYAGSAAGVV